ncbi:hypothetical protein [Rhodoferax lacus]|uniref:hypothetical protein n=1 Tax=Rhodoferax lacus TaxID=2184758 RepID=UPI001F29796B|nr:hypothetical protein [Rhodoferax lacus]
MRSPSRSAQTRQQVIHIEPLAAAKPPMGAACNGCGLCCLAEPCPLGVLLSRSRSGPCKALRWVEAERQYRCGALGQTQASRGLVRLKAWLTAWVVRRWIAAGVGCDCDLEPTASATISATSPISSNTSHD